MLQDENFISFVVSLLFHKMGNGATLNIILDDRRGTDPKGHLIIRDNLVPRTFSLAWGREKALGRRLSSRVGG